MNDDFCGANWKIMYTHVPIVGAYATISHEEFKQQAIEKQLELEMFTEAQELIAKVKHQL